MYTVNTEQDMLKFAAAYGRKLRQTFRSPEIASKVIELVGDVGTGKTTFVRGLARGLGVVTPITSPSFTISKIYPLPNSHNLVHYDFYRIPDPGLMRDELAETLSDPYKIVVVEWADSIKDLLPDERLIIKFSYADPNSSSPSSSRRLEFILPNDTPSNNSSFKNIIEP